MSWARVTDGQSVQAADWVAETLPTRPWGTMSYNFALESIDERSENFPVSEMVELAKVEQS